MTQDNKDLWTSAVQTTCICTDFKWWASLTELDPGLSSKMAAVRLCKPRSYISIMWAKGGTAACHYILYFILTLPILTASKPYFPPTNYLNPVIPVEGHEVAIKEVALFYILVIALWTKPTRGQAYFQRINESVNELQYVLAVQPRLFLTI